MPRLSIRQKQIIGVLTLVGLVVVALSLLNLANIARLSLEESRARAALLVNAVFHRAREVVTSRETAYSELQADAGVRSILESAIYSEDVTYAAIVDADGVARAHSDPTRVGERMSRGGDLAELLGKPGLQQLYEVFRRARTLEWREPILLEDQAFGEIRIGVSTLLVQRDLDEAIRPALFTALGALGIAFFLATLLAQAVLRPIHVIQSGLTRLGRGEFGVTLDLQEAEVQDLRGVFDAVSQQLRALPTSGGEARKEVAQLSKRIAALGRLTAGVAHEVKNPLNSMTIHLELLRQKLERGAPVPDVRQHADIIGNEIRRLDAVVQGFLKFARPEDMRIERLSASAMLADVARTIRPEAEGGGVALEQATGDERLSIEADATMLRQALLNLAVNALQAMPKGGHLSLGCREGRDGRVEIHVRDSGVGIPPEHLARIFDLYFTTKQRGSGIGLSMVFRTVQLHNGDIDVESTPGVGTTFTIRLPKAA